MSDKLKDVAIKLDEIENNISELKDHIKNMMEYVQTHHSAVAQTVEFESNDGEKKE
jgi:uncharacterized protein Yka (UPF0111/DUF47 family)